MIHLFIDRVLLASPVAKHYRAYKCWRWGEPEIHLVPTLCEKNKVSIDVGASRGLYSYFMGRESHHCLAFEPNHELHSQLRSQAVNTTVYGYALSDRCTMTELRIPRENGRLRVGAATIEPANRFSAEVVNVKIEARTLDSFGLQNVGFIKVDTEGHELAFLKGAARTIRSNRPRMLIEAEDRHRAGALSSVAEFLKSFDYDGFFLFERKLFPVAEFDARRHQRNSGSAYVANFAFLPCGDPLGRSWSAGQTRSA